MSTQKNYESKFSEIMGRLMSVSGKTKDLEVAEILGLKKVAFAARKKRGSIPEKEIKIACANNGWSYDFIMTGRGGKTYIVEAKEITRADEEHHEYQPEFNERDAIFQKAKEETKEMSDAEFYKVMGAIFGVIEDMKTKKGGQ